MSSYVEGCLPMFTPANDPAVDPSSGSVQLRHSDTQYQDTGQLTRLSVVTDYGERSNATQLVESFVGRYTNPKTAQQYRAELTALFAYTGAAHPRALTDAAVNHWVARARANNTRRGRLARVCTFLRWCMHQGHADPALVEELGSRENPLRATPPLYGKLQGKYPARWLTHEEAFGALLGVCDESDVGRQRRDELVLRLGLAGMRVAEIVHLQIGDLRLGRDPTVEWIGKKARPEGSRSVRLCSTCWMTTWTATWTPCTGRSDHRTRSSAARSPVVGSATSLGASRSNSRAASPSWSPCGPTRRPWGT